MVKVKVKELRDIPASIVFGEGDDFQTKSWTVLVVIQQEEMLGVVAPDQDPIPAHANPHPILHQATSTKISIIISWGPYNIMNMKINKLLKAPNLIWTYNLH